MTLLFMDSVDHYTSFADLERKWQGVQSQASAFISVTAAAARYGAGGIRAANNAYLARNLGAFHPTLIAGFAFRPAIAAGRNAIAIYFDGATQQVTLGVDGGGRLEVRRAGALLGTGSAVLAPNAWVYIEWKVIFGTGVAGSAEVRVNGLADIVLAGVNTAASGTARADAFAIRNEGSGGNGDYDDLWVDTATFHGDCRVEALLPDGVGATSAWTPSAAVPNWQTVDENPPNGDTDYVSSATAAQVDTYAMSALATAAGTVKGVQSVLYARKDDAGARTIRRVIRRSAVDYPGTTVSVGDAFAMFAQVAELDPSTAAAWTIAGVNAAELGQELVS